jgi:hypothetical protein
MVVRVGADKEQRECKRPYDIPTEDKNFLRLNPPMEVDLFVLFVAHNKAPFLGNLIYIF